MDNDDDDDDDDEEEEDDNDILPSLQHTLPRTASPVTPRFLQCMSFR
jgi:hypothetical protein